MLVLTALASPKGSMYAQALMFRQMPMVDSEMLASGRRPVGVVHVRYGMGDEKSGGCQSHEASGDNHTRWWWWLRRRVLS